MGAPARLCHRNGQSRAPVAKRISGGGEPDPERSDQRSAAAFGRRKGGTGRDRSPPGSKGTGGRGGNGQARYDSGLVSEAHREQIRWVEIPSKCRAPQGRSGNRTPGGADGERKSELGLRSDRRCLGKSRASSMRSDGGQRPPSPRHLSSAEAKAIDLMEELYPRTPGRFGGNGLLHDGSPNAQRVDDLLCAVLDPLGDSPGESGRVYAVPGSGVDGAAGAKHDHGGVGMPERVQLSAA